MIPGVRKAALTGHLVVSVGWLGAAVAVLGLSVVGQATGDEQTARSAYVAMQPLCWYVLVPLSVASLVTGVVQALGTPWGLVRHYWVLTKLGLNLVATGVLLLFANTVAAHTARMARDPAVSMAELDRLGAESLAHAVVAVVALLAAVLVAVYKPWGRTPFDRRDAVRRGSGRPDIRVTPTP